jgi:hypothetical protein
MFQNDGGALRARGARSARARTACCFRQRAAALPPRSRARAPAPLRHSCRAAGGSQLLSLSSPPSLSLPLFPSPTSQGPRAQKGAPPRALRRPGGCGQLYPWASGIACSLQKTRWQWRHTRPSSFTFWNLQALTPHVSTPRLRSSSCAQRALRERGETRRAHGSAAISRSGGRGARGNAAAARSACGPMPLGKCPGQAQRAPASVHRCLGPRPPPLPRPCPKTARRRRHRRIQRLCLSPCPPPPLRPPPRPPPRPRARAPAPPAPAQVP